MSGDGRLWALLVQTDFILLQQDSFEQFRA